jgi:RES domain-containing protein
MLVFRIVHRKYTDLIPAGMQGRWNSPGNKVIYAAESIPLAFLETMIRRQGAGFSDLFKIVTIQIPDTLAIEEVSPQALDPDWRFSSDPIPCQLVGDQWYHEARSAVLKVPSAVLPYCYNYVINCQHPAWSNIKILAITGLVPDPRIEEILIKYR